MSFVAGYIWGKMSSSRSGGGSSSTAGAVAGITALALIVGGVATWAIVDSNQTKSARNDLNTAVARHADMQSVSIDSFDMITGESNDYFFKFTGTAMNTNGDQIDFFSAKYKVDETEFQEVADYMKKNKIDELSTKKILKKVLGIIENAELVSTTARGNVSEQAGLETLTEKVILSVSKPQVEDDKVSYYVSYTEGVQTSDQQTGLLTKVCRVSYPKTDELANNPSAVFAQDKDGAEVQTVKEGLYALEQGTALVIDGEATFQM